MKVIYQPKLGNLACGPFVQFTDEEHLDIDESLALAERTLRESTVGELDITVNKVMNLHNLRDALHPVWKLVKDSADSARKEVSVHTYQGLRHSEVIGGQLVMKDDTILSPVPSQKLYNHSPDGFNWGYHGSGPAQLALALLLDATANPGLSVRLHQDFNSETVASWQDDWKITSEEILAWVEGR